MNFISPSPSIDRYEKPVISVRPKRKIAYLPPVESNNQLSPDRGVRKLPLPLNPHLKAPVSLSRSVDSSSPGRLENLSDVSYVSTTSTNSQRGRQKVLAGDHRLGNNHVPEHLKERALHPHAHLPSRYKESPYVLALKNSPKRNVPLSLDLKDIEVPAGLNYKKQNLKSPPAQVRNKNPRGASQKK